ncbi:MAG TPA: hypothetical protein VK348_08595 [Planctomycetota bacterium]|nr:hypothetical protein [Planctomycetota bacterium]
MTKSTGYGLLAMAVSASIALANGGGDDDKKNPTLYQGGSGGVSFKPGSGITFDGGDEFRLNLKTYAQTQWTYAVFDNTEDLQTFRIRRIETTMTGNVYNKNLTYKLALDWVDTQGTPLRDMWAQWNFIKDDNNRLGVRLGQSRTFFGLETTGTSSGLELAERSLATRTFTDTRGRGAWIHGGHMENRLRWNFGIQNNDVSAGSTRLIIDSGEETSNSGSSLDWVGNVSYDLMGDMTGGKDNEALTQGDLAGTENAMGTIGGGVFIGNDDRVTGVLGSGVSTATIQTVSWNVNTEWKVNHLALLGEFFSRSDNGSGAAPFGTAPTETSTGWYVQGSYTLPKSGDSEMQWGLVGRISMISADNTSTVLNVMGPQGSQGGLFANEDVTELTAGVNAFYHGHACKTQFNYTYQDRNLSVGTDQKNHILQIMFQITL